MQCTTQLSSCLDGRIDDILKRILKQSTNPKRRIIVGLGGAQGSGKSTLSRLLHQRLSEFEHHCIVLSLDDFYLCAKERCHAPLALLRTRGAPGTHDTALLNVTLNTLLTQTETDVEWPVFSKQHDDRLSDQGNKATLPPMHDPLVIILEGWCVGCKPLTNISEPVNDLERYEDIDCSWRSYIDAQIRHVYAPLWERLDMYIFLRVPDWEHVRLWRMQQAVTNGEPVECIDRFLLFFERISKQMLTDRIHTDLEIVLGDNHEIECTVE